MSRKFLALAVVAVIVLTSLWIFSLLGRKILAEHRTREANALAIGKPVAPFSLKDPAGREYRLPTPGRRVLINYWTTWCGPCLKEMPVLQDFARRNGNRTRVVGIALDRDEEGALAWLASNPPGFLVLFEAPSETDSSVALGNRSGVVPYNVLIGADGRVLATKTGAFASRARLEAWVAAAR